MTLNEFKRLNKSKGFYWFERDTIRFFRSIISNFDESTGYFISSEQGPDQIRRYSIRKGDFTTGNVTTIGEFGGFKTLYRAKAVMVRLMEGHTT